jgi:hypothetical protein
MKRTTEPHVPNDRLFSDELVLNLPDAPQLIKNKRVDAVVENIVCGYQLC